MEHSKYEQRDGCGENLAMSGADDMRDSDDATMMWYDELNDPGYDYNNHGFGMGTGHFT